MRAADPDARRRAVREDPRVEVRRQAPLVVHVAARPVEIRRAGGRRAHDLVVGEDVGQLARPRYRLPGDRRVRAVGADHRARAHAHAFAAGRPIAHHRRAVGIPFQLLEGPGAPARASRRRATAQPLVEHVAIDHADEPALDRHVHAPRSRRHHARCGHAGDQELVRDRELLDQFRRNRAAAGLDPPRPIEQQHVTPATGEVAGRGRPGRAAADHDRIEALCSHCDHPPPRPATAPPATTGNSTWARRSSDAPTPAASAAAIRNSAASPANTLAYAGAAAPNK